MSAFLKIADLIRHGKILTVVKPFLSVILVGGITYAIFQKSYGVVILPDSFSLRKTAEYFLNGDFIVPFGIFFLLWAVTSIVCNAVFDLINLKITDKVRLAIDKTNFIDPQRTVEDAQLNAKLFLKVPRKQWTVRLYEAVRNKLGDYKIDEIDRRLQMAQIEYASDFVLIVRSVIAIVIYFNTVAYFGWVLFFALIILLVILCILIFISYQFAALLPIVASKYSEEYKVYQRQRQILIVDEKK